MDISKRSINDILRTSNNLIIPFYQREYTWNQEEIKRLLEDIVSCETNNYYLGSLVLKNHKTSRVIIDGQQRISTIWLILKAIYDKNDQLDKDYSNEIKRDLEGFEFKTMNLKDAGILKNIITDNTSSFSEKEEQSNYFLNYQQIKSHLNTYNVDLNLFYINLRKIVFALVIAEEKIDEHILFSQINSTGKKLTAFDLVKNYLFSKINERYLNEENLDKKLEEKTNLLTLSTDCLKNDKDKNSFIRHFISYKTNELVNNDSLILYASFVDLFDKKIYSDILTAFDDLYLFATIYKYILNKEWLGEKYEKSMNILYPSSNTYMALFIDIFHRNSNLIDKKIIINELQKSNINKSLMVLEYYKVTREFYGSTEKTITRFIPKLVNEINKLELNISYEAKLFYKLYTEPNRDIKRNNDFKYRMPRNVEFKSSFYSFNLYKKQSFCKILLIRLSSFQEKMKIDFKTFTIEHILPQTLTDWRAAGYKEGEMDIVAKEGTIGNLTLTNYNGESSNKVFSHKQKIMEKEGWKFNDYFLNLQKWDLYEIQKRSEYLFDKINEIWNFSEIEKEIQLSLKEFNN